MRGARMNSQNIGSLVRIALALLLASTIWAASKYFYARPDVEPAGAPATVFSATRAYATLGRVLGPERPHPAGSAENAAVRARIIAEFAKLGVEAQTHKAFACNAWRGFAAISCASVTDILAEIVPGKDKAIVLLAHYDSVPAGPGASDDESGVATVLETARALRARAANSLHPVLAVITDGEEFGLLGAQAFLNDPALKAHVGAVINVEARGTRGRSLLFQTSPGDGRLIDLYAASVNHYATSSLYAEIYRFLPNDTDLTLFIRQGFPSFNFAFADNVADYHTPLDRRENLDLTTLQEHGENMLGVAGALEHTDYADLKSGDAVYLDLFGAVLPRLPASWALPLAIAALLALIGGAFPARGDPLKRRDLMFAFLLPPALLVGCALAGLGLHFLAQTISDQPDPSYAHPQFLRVALVLGVLATTLAIARMAEARAAAIAVWVWFAALSVLSAAFLPGLSPYFLFPALVAAVTVLITLRRPRSRWVREAALLIASVSALVIWIGLVASGEALMGLQMHPLFTIPAAFGVMTLVPLLKVRELSLRAWLSLVAASFVAAIVAAIYAGLQPAFSESAAQRLSLVYVEDAATGRAHWAAGTMAPLPPELRAAADFSRAPQAIFPGRFPPAYSAPAGNAHLAPAHAEIWSDVHAGNRRKLTIALHGSPQAAGMILFIPKTAMLKSISIGGRYLAAPAGTATDTVLACLTPDCAQARVTMDVDTRVSFDLRFAEERFGLPPEGAKLIGARPNTAIPSQNGDVTLLLNKLKVAAAGGAR